jgi:N-acetylglutamate synthase-like GNAT family acetyltransferase
MEPRSYVASDYADCLALFDSCALGDRQAFERFLSDADGAQLTVLEHENAIAGFGGFIIGTDGSADLLWGMIRPSLRCMGLGRFLLMYRLRQISKSGIDVSFVRVATTAQSAPFYEKQGFKRQSVQAGGAVELVMKLKVCP